MKQHHPYDGPIWNDGATGTANDGTAGSASIGPNVPCKFAYLSSAKDASAPAFVVRAADGTGGIPLHSNMPVYVPCTNLNQLYFYSAAGDGTINYHVFR